MTIREIELKLKENKQQMEILTKQIEKNQKINQFKVLQELTIKLARLQKMYDDNMTLLGFAYPDEIDDKTRLCLEMEMPLIEKALKDIQEQLDLLRNNNG